MSHGKQFTLYTHVGGPNGWKVAQVLELLGLSYESVYLDFGKGEHKGPEFTKINPNGRIPALIDHKKNDFAIWESGAIIYYLLENYDPTHKLSPSDPLERASLLQWLFFQASGQGPYFGQIAWFLKYHPERIPSAVERYRNEALRVLGVLESVLSKQPWLVGDKLTAADISFISWNLGAFSPGLFEEAEVAKIPEKFPATAAWHKKLTELPEVARLLEKRQKLLSAQ